ncbi:MAG: carboxypeptidase-like regulatory domain-containing protein [Candidatus Aminicenantes bacterium]|nr:carboxypeptidase-like regulatory domain-containing protein [Candidatus Aminicenantes bacterium]
MRLNRCKIFFIFLLLSIRCFGQSGLLMSVYGRVLDVNTNLPVKEFVVTLFRLENGEIVDTQIGKTDDRGIYKIRYLRAGDYEYLIEVPNIGMIYIGRENDDGSCYEFTLKEGRNLNLNFFIGASKIFDIKKEIKYDNIINVTFLYGEETPEIESRYMLASSSGCQLSIANKAPEPVEVADDVNLGTARNGGPAAGRYEYKLIRKKHEYSCENDKCKLDRITLSINETIKIHSEKWFKDTYGQNYKDGFAGCIKDCLLLHENIHKEDARKYAEDNFCKAMEKLNNVKAKCDCPLYDPESVKCANKSSSLYEQFKDDMKDYMETTSEDNAYAISNPCCQQCQIIFK